MRADRLIALTMLLQARGSITAAEAARELEVSTRTARRDLEALSMSGVPVYSQPGRGGGWYLVGGARTDLTGLNESEATALFLAASTSVDSTVMPAELKKAIRKLAAAIPEPFRETAASASQTIHVDPVGWGRSPTVDRPDRFIDPLVKAITENRQVEMTYRSRSVAVDQDPPLRRVGPLGLVVKAQRWYLIAIDKADKAVEDPETGRDGGEDYEERFDIRSFRVDRIGSLTMLPDMVQRPPDFDLGETWSEISASVEEMRNVLEVEARCHRSILWPLRTIFGTNLHVEDAGDDQWCSIRIGGFGARPIAVQIAGFGRQVQLVDPPAELAEELARIGTELLSDYGDS